MQMVSAFSKKIKMQAKMRVVVTLMKLVETFVKIKQLFLYRQKMLQRKIAMMQIAIKAKIMFQFRFKLLYG